MERVPHQCFQLIIDQAQIGDCLVQTPDMDNRVGLLIEGTLEKGLE
jgi:hypothetical protein